MGQGRDSFGRIGGLEQELGVQASWTPLARLGTQDDMADVVLAAATHLLFASGIVMPIDDGRPLAYAWRRLSGLHYGFGSDLRRRQSAPVTFGPERRSGTKLGAAGQPAAGWLL